MAYSLFKKYHPPIYPQVLAWHCQTTISDEVTIGAKFTIGAIFDAIIICCSGTIF